MRLRTLFLASVLLAAPAWAGDFHPDLARVGEAPRYAVNGAAVAKALALQPERKELPLRFAVGVAMPLKLADGRWDTLDADTLSWRLRVASAGAKLLSFGFDQLRLPPSARLYVYEPYGALVQGPYTAREAAADGRLWTAVVRGEEAVLELRVAPAERDRIALELGTVYHGYRAFSATAKELGEAASCEVDAICKTAGNSGLGDSARAVALYQFRNGSGLFLCSGQLLNNTQRDDTPYFLSAHHCLSQAGFAPSMVVYWNFQNSRCGGSDADAFTQTQSGGAVQVATDARADFTLVRLNQEPQTSFNVYYAGWDVSGSVPQSGVTFHHPQADAKKVSTYTQPAQAVNNVPLQDEDGTTIGQVDAWQVSWSQGITERGSSGSGLLDQNRRVVGVLSGGDTACPLLGGPPSGTDVFGRLALGWNNSSALRAALDPCGAGVSALDGKEPGALNQCVPAGTSSGGSSGGSGVDSGGGGGAVPAWLALLLIPAAALRRRRQAG